jgi:hypothetical protein
VLLFFKTGTKNACPTTDRKEYSNQKGEIMIRRVCISFVFGICLFIFFTPAFAQNEISGWWSVKGTYLQGDFVTGDWTTLQARGKKVSYFYFFQKDSTSGTGSFVLFDESTSSYILETYTLFFKNNIVVLYIPTSFDESGNPAAATIVMRAFGSAGRITTMSGYYTLYDMENESTPDQFVRMGPVFATRVQPFQVPDEVKLLIP